MSPVLEAPKTGCTLPESDQLDEIVDGERVEKMFRWVKVCRRR